MTSCASSFDDLLGADSLAPNAIQDLVRRMELLPQLLRRQQEEQITSLVRIEPDWLSQQRDVFCGKNSLDDTLKQHRWSQQDLDLHLARPEALRRFAEQRFGPGLEEAFLGAQGNHDEVIYSVLRVSDYGLAQELWIRLEEAESTFAELASIYGEGPEAARKGLMGPLPLGGIVPQQLAKLLRTLQPGEVHSPTRLGEWLVLLRLEQLTPARFDANMRTFLLNQQIDTLLESRVQKILEGEPLDSLEYDPPQ